MGYGVCIANLYARIKVLNIKLINPKALEEQFCFVRQSPWSAHKIDNHRIAENSYTIWMYRLQKWVSNYSAHDRFAFLLSACHRFYFHFVFCYIFKSLHMISNVLLVDIRHRCERPTSLNRWILNNLWTGCKAKPTKIGPFDFRCSDAMDIGQSFDCQRSRPKRFRSCQQHSNNKNGTRAKPRKKMFFLIYVGVSLTPMSSESEPFFFVLMICIFFLLRQSASIKFSLSFKLICSDIRNENVFFESN